MSPVLIVSEKAIAARRIAEILSDGSAKAEKRGSVPVFRFERNGESYTSVGLKGHILKVDFPEEHARWSRKRLEELVDAEIVKVPSEPDFIKALKQEAKGARDVVIATDFDREGELIGADAMGQVLAVAPEARFSRARFSALTPQEVDRAFSELEEPYATLAEAGAARQDIDLIWGAVLTRYLSLVASKRGHDFLSAGRVQTPTLALIVQRELERRAFEPVPYWVIQGRFEADGTPFTAGHATDRFWDESEAACAMARLEGAASGTVEAIEVSSRSVKPPAPFHTTSLMAAAASVGLSPKRTMDLAESLYMNGFISYPRTDNTVYPESLDLAGLVGNLTAAPDLAPHAKAVLAQPKITPTRGAKQTTDHPPVHPTAVPDLDSIRSDQRKVWELVARRFLATLSQAATIESTKVRLDVAGEPFAMSGQRVVTEGWLGVYPYGRQRDREVPALERGQEVAFLGADLSSKETQPPARFSQGVLIQEMEKLGLGTKATRHDIIQTLYDRGYVDGDPLAPTSVGEAVAEVMSRYGGPIATPEMTAALEASMDRIAAGDVERGAVVAESRKGLHEVMSGLMEHWDSVREEMKTASAVGTCPTCGLLMVVRTSRRGGRFAGCTGYPECTQTFPLPATGRLEAGHGPCAQCGSPKVAHHAPKAKEAVERCINPACPTNDEPEVEIGTCPKCGSPLMLMRSKKTGKRFVRCSRYEDEADPCLTSYPVPQSGSITRTDERCEPCGSPRVVVETRRGPWKICLDPECSTKTKTAKGRKKGTGRRRAASSGAPAARRRGG